MRFLFISFVSFSRYMVGVKRECMSRFSIYYFFCAAMLSSARVTGIKNGFIAVISAAVVYPYFLVDSFHTINFSS